MIPQLTHLRNEETVHFNNVEIRSEANGTFLLHPDQFNVRVGTRTGYTTERKIERNREKGRRAKTAQKTQIR